MLFTAAVPLAPSGMDSTSFPRIPSIMPPPRVLCRRISSGIDGNRAGSVTAVSCEPTMSASEETIIPANGPDNAKSNMAALFLGGYLKVVTVLVIPVMIDGTKVGTLVLICMRKEKTKWESVSWGRNNRQA